MKRDLAVNIIDAAQALNKPIDHLTNYVRAIEDEAERKRMLLFIAGMIADIYNDVMRPVLKKYPDLDPHYPNEPGKWLKPD
jgi:hypothetical protein